MKRLKVVVAFVMTFVAFAAFAQDTIPANLKGQSAYQSSSYPEPQIVRQGDSLTITGYTVANCAGTHLAIVKHAADTVYISFKDTGMLATCIGVLYSYKLKIRAHSSESVCVVSGQPYSISSKLWDVDVQKVWVDAVYESSSGCLKIETKSNIGLKCVSIYDAAGKLQLTVAGDRSSIDFSDFGAGVYLLEFVSLDDRHFSKKVLKVD